MVDEPPIKVFISHASEDKVRFVEEFATRLRQDGVDAWLDKWEMAPGDSLVGRIFEEGIGGADVFLVVLSDHSVSKPWVREELDAGVVRRIEGACRLIPLVLDSVEVPVALKATVWQQIPDPSSYDTEYQAVLGAIFGVSQRPPIGEPPAYAAAEAVPELTAADTIVLQALVEICIEQGQRHVHGPDLEERLDGGGLGVETIIEAIHALDAERLIEQADIRDGHVLRVKVGWGGVLKHLAHTKPELGETQQTLLSHLVNRNAQSYELSDLAAREGITGFVAEALLVPYESRDLLTIIRSLGDHTSIRGVSPLLRRELQ